MFSEWGLSKFGGYFWKKIWVFSNLVLHFFLLLTGIQREFGMDVNILKP